MIEFSKFEELELAKELLAGIQESGYRRPTPIQRKAIPLALDGRDVVVMARTGSGKTAVFLVPLLHKLKKRQEDGIRAIIISPTRDLAIQTSKFFLSIGKYLDLTCAVVVGGESMEDQFMALLKNPDIIIGTPGRILHVIAEMSLSLKRVETVIFDEADRLYEMGFLQDLKDIIKQTAKNKQLMMVSATLPKNLLQFSSIEMQDAEFVRLDADATLSDKLKLFHFYVKKDQKIATLIYLVTKIIPQTDQTIIFAQSKHHVDLIQEVLNIACIKSSISYSRMDEEDRRINMNNFRFGKTHIMISTDIAARGLDIPSLDNIINYNFPSSAKIFVHRAGRVARAGREGCGYSLVSIEELPYLLDFYQNLEKDLIICSENQDKNIDNIIGSVPQKIVDEIASQFPINENSNIKLLIQTSLNSEKKIKKFSTKCPTKAVEISKSLNLSSICIHPLFKKLNEKNIEETTFTTIGFKPKKKPMGTHLDGVIQARENMKIEPRKKKQITKTKIPLSSHKKQEPEMKYKKFTDSFHLPQRPVGDSHEKLFKLEEFKNADGMTLELMDDELNSLQNRKKNFKVKWDRKAKRHVNVEVKQKKKIKTESGIEIDSTYATNHYKKWLKKTGINSIINTKNSNSQWNKSLDKVCEQINHSDYKKVRKNSAKSMNRSNKKSFRFKHKN